ncbi:hypothetical protein Ciccas_005378 [Cichlidogyrus casuarinus]|uniref:Vesicle transport protein n=1 Tax=Cichlidogyrus casuarinus TaxID=1844966 RepID=A0ABD2Q8T3_9PLAT
MSGFDYFKLQTDASASKDGALSQWRSYIPSSFIGQRPPKDEDNVASEESAEGTTQSRFANWFAAADSDPCLPSMSRKQRMLGFVMCLLLASLCLSLSLILLPVLAAPSAMRKFVLLHTVGSILLIASFGFIWGPTNHFKSLFSLERIALTLAYAAMLFLALYAVLRVKSAILALCAFGGQISIILYQLTSWIPGGRLGLKYFAKGTLRIITGATNTLLPT